MKLPKILLVAFLLALLAPAAANADSIVYIDQGNVWSATPDGARKVQLTTGGGWHSPTQADDGTIAAVQGAGPIQVMARDGRPIRTITTEMAPSSNGGVFEPRPQDLSFSPDGTKIAYSYYSFSCPPGSSCGAQRSTFYTDATTATPIATYGNQFGVSNPEWVTNTRTLVFGGYGRQVSIDDLGPGDYSHVPWMVPDGDMGDGEITRDGKRLAVTSDYGENTRLSFFAVTGDVTSGAPPAYPEWACSMTNPDPNFADPSWAPDGAGIAWQSSKGIEVSRFTVFGPGQCEAPNDLLLTATGSEPDWGPADTPAAAFTPSSEPTPTTPAAAKITLSKATAKALRKGLAVKVSVPAAGKLTLVASVKGRKVASGKATAKKAGTITVKLSKVHRSLRGKTLTFKLTVNSTTVTKSLKVR
jgi:hypothetical protein